MSTPDFSCLPLHDALLESITLLWKQKICRLHLEAFAVPGKSASPHLLEFQGVELVNAPLNDSWGPSYSVNSATHTSGKFFIEMQSGDIIEVRAATFTFVAL